MSEASSNRGARGDRRGFLKGAAAATAGAAAALSGCLSREQVGLGANAATDPEGPVILGRTHEWTMVTTWPATMPIFQEGAKMMAERIAAMSQGRLKISVYGGGELVPAFESFDAVSAGTAQMAHGAAYYWAGKEPAGQFFSSIPFGMNAQQVYGWLFGGDGLELWTELYEPFGVLPFPAGNTGGQMGGWFRDEIRSIDDFAGLKMRIPGLGGRVLTKLGGSAVLLPGGEIYTSLERGVIDATEWVGPFHDELMGFHNVAKNYYYPGWHEPGTVLELTVNRSAWDSLSSDLQTIIQVASAELNTWMLSQFEAKNHAALQRLIRDAGVRLHSFPADVIAALKTTAAEVIDEVVAGDPKSAKIFASYDAFRKSAASWSGLSEAAFYNLIQDAAPVGGEA